MLHAFQLLVWNECNYPIAFAYFIGAHAVMFYFLFSNFYKQAYTAKKVSTYYIFCDFVQASILYNHFFYFRPIKQRKHRSYYIKMVIWNRSQTKILKLRNFRMKKCLSMKLSIQWTTVTQQRGTGSL